ncbi:MAG: hypothetical protein LBC94_06640, partial [Desulfovibrio sp.]|nr:hypothetical protein [Desulfovibrio sp.]
FLLCIQRADLRQNGREVFLLHTLPLTEIYPYSINYATRANDFKLFWRKIEKSAHYPPLLKSEAPLGF